MRTYTAQCFGDTYRIRGDFADAASPIWVETEDGDWASTPHQVADFRHRAEAAMRHILEEQAAMSGDDAEDYAEEIARAVDRMTACEWEEVAR